MIAMFVLGAALGLGVGWWISQRWYAAELRLVTEQSLRLTDLLAEASALNARYSATLEELKPSAAAPASISPMTNTRKNVNVETSVTSTQVQASNSEYV